MMRITDKGQITIPPAMRKKHGLRARAEIQLVDRPEGILVVKAARPSAGKRVLASLLRGGRVKARTSNWLRLTRAELSPYPESVLAKIYRDMTAEEKESESRMAKASVRPSAGELD